MLSSDPDALALASSLDIGDAIPRDAENPGSDLISTAIELARLPFRDKPHERFLGNVAGIRFVQPEPAREADENRPKAGVNLCVIRPVQPQREGERVRVTSPARRGPAFDAG